MAPFAVLFADGAARNRRELGTIDPSRSGAGDAPSAGRRGRRIAIRRTRGGHGRSASSVRRGPSASWRFKDSRAMSAARVPGQGRIAWILGGHTGAGDAISDRCWTGHCLARKSRIGFRRLTAIRAPADTEVFTPVPTILSCPSCGQKNRVADGTAPAAKCGACGAFLTGITLRQKSQTHIVARSGSSLVRLEPGDLDRDWDSVAVGVVYLLIDRSGSMGGEKLEQARSGALQYARAAIHLRHSVGIISFATTAGLVSKASLSMDSIEAAAATIVSGGVTNLHLALALALDLLSEQNSRSTMVVVTDGKPDDREAALREALRAKQAGVTIVTIGTDDADLGFLKELASRPETTMRTSVPQLSTTIASAARLLSSRSPQQ